jgi:hypothetical protein
MKRVAGAPVTDWMMSVMKSSSVWKPAAPRLPLASKTKMTSCVTSTGVALDGVSDARTRKSAATTPCTNLIFFNHHPIYPCAERNANEMNMRVIFFIHPEIQFNEFGPLG